MDDVFDFLKFVAVIFIILACFFGGILGFVVWTGHNACQSYETMGIPVQWDFWAGCMADHPTFGWVPVDEYFEILNLNVPK